MTRLITTIMLIFAIGCLIIAWNAPDTLASWIFIALAALFFYVPAIMSLIAEDRKLDTESLVRELKKYRAKK